MTYDAIHMSALGNDYLYFDGLSETLDVEALTPHIPAMSKQAETDGVILMLPHEQAHVQMVVFNKDGSRAQMCGNGLRCVVRYVLDYLTDDDEVLIETDAGPMMGIETGEGEICVRLEPMPKVSTEMQILEVLDQTFSYYSVCVGNPHAVIASPMPLADLPLETWGPAIENNEEHFPEKTNIEFYMIDSPAQLSMRVWERGSGETKACGTGAAAVASLYRYQNPQHNSVSVTMPGGPLCFDWNQNQFFMTGPAIYVKPMAVDKQTWLLTPGDPV